MGQFFEKRARGSEMAYLSWVSWHSHQMDAGKEDLIDSFKKLSMFEREVANLLLLDYSPSEIAKRLNVKDKVVYNSIQRCKIKMKQYLLKYKC